MRTSTLRIVPLLALVGCHKSEPAPTAQPSAVASATHEMPHRFDKAEDWAKIFDDPTRDSWQMPLEVVRRLDLGDGRIVVDLGAGTGYFEPYLAFSTAPSGKVIAADVEPDMIRYLGERVKREGLSNVTPKLVAADDPGLADASVDRVLVVDTWHHLGSRKDYAVKLARALKPGGFVLVVDFTMESEMGPPKEHRISPEQVMAELEAAGLHPSSIDRALPQQYVVRAEKPRESQPATASASASSATPPPSASSVPSASAPSPSSALRPKGK